MTGPAGAAPLAVAASGAAPRPGPGRGDAASRLTQAAAWSFLLFAAALPVAVVPMSIAAGVCGALTLATWIVRRGPGLVRTPPTLPAAVWIAALGLAALFALDPRGSAADPGKALLPFVAGVAAGHALERRRATAALIALLAAGSVASLVGWAGFLAEGGRFPARAIGLAGSWMTFGLQLQLLVSLACGIAATASRRAWRAGALAASLACAARLVTSFTRGARLGLAVSPAVLVGLRRPRALLEPYGSPAAAERPSHVHNSYALAGIAHATRGWEEGGSRNATGGPPRGAPGSPPGAGAPPR